MSARTPILMRVRWRPAYGDIEHESVPMPEGRARDWALFIELCGGRARQVAA